LISLCAIGMPHTVEKLSTMATTFLWTSPQSKVYTQSYGPPKLRESQFREFRDSNLGVLGQNDIWVLAPWLGTKNTIRGRWWLPLSLGHDESCDSVFARGSFMHQKCFDYALINLLFGLCRSVWIIELLVTRLSPHLGALAHLSTPKVLQTRERVSILYPSTIVILNSHLSLSRSLGVSIWVAR